MQWLFFEEVAFGVRARGCNPIQGKREANEVGNEVGCECG